MQTAASSNVGRRTSGTPDGHPPAIVGECVPTLDSFRVRAADLISAGGYRSEAVTVDGYTIVACHNSRLVDGTQARQELVSCSLTYVAQPVPGGGYRLLSNGSGHSVTCKQLEFADLAERSTAAPMQEKVKQAVKLHPKEVTDGEAAAKSGGAVALLKEGAQSIANKVGAETCKRQPAEAASKEVYVPPSPASSRQSSITMSISDDEHRHATEEAIRNALKKAEAAPIKRTVTPRPTTSASEAADASADLLAAIEASPDHSPEVARFPSLAFSRPSPGIDPRLAIRNRTGSLDVRQPSEGPAEKQASPTLKTEESKALAPASSASHSRSSILPSTATSASLSQTPILKSAMRAASVPVVSPEEERVAIANEALSRGVLARSSGATSQHLSAMPSPALQMSRSNSSDGVMRAGGKSEPAIKPRLSVGTLPAIMPDKANETAPVARQPIPIFPAQSPPLASTSTSGPAGSLPLAAPRPNKSTMFVPRKPALTTVPRPVAPPRSTSSGSATLPDFVKKATTQSNATLSSQQAQATSIPAFPPQPVRTSSMTATGSASPSRLFGAKDNAREGVNDAPPAQPRQTSPISVKAKFQATCASATSVKAPSKPSTSSAGATRDTAGDPYKVGHKFKSVDDFYDTLLKYVRDQGHDATKFTQTGKPNSRGVEHKYTYIKCRNKGGADDKVPGTSCKYAINGKEVEKGEYAITFCDFQHNTACIAKVALEAVGKSKANASTPAPDAGTSVEAHKQKPQGEQEEEAEEGEGMSEQSSRKKKKRKHRHGKTPAQRRERDRLANLATDVDPNSVSASRQNDSDHVPDTPDAANSSSSEELPDLSAVSARKPSLAKTVKRKVSMDPPVRKTSSKRMIVDSDAESSDGEILTVARTVLKPSKKVRNEPTIIDPEDYTGPPKFGDTFGSKDAFVEAMKDFISESGFLAVQRKCRIGKAKIVCKNSREPISCPYAVTAEDVSQKDHWTVTEFELKHNAECEKKVNSQNKSTTATPRESPQPITAPRQAEPTSLPEPSQSIQPMEQKTSKPVAALEPKVSQPIQPIEPIRKRKATVEAVSTKRMKSESSPELPLSSSVGMSRPSGPTIAAIAAPIRVSPERIPTPPTAPLVKRESPGSPPPPPGTSAASAIPVESPVPKSTPPVPGPSREASQRPSSELRANVAPASAPASTRSSVHPGGLPDSLKRFYTYLEKAGIDTLERLHDVLDPRLHAEEPDWLKEWMSFMQEEGCGLSNKSDEFMFRKAIGRYFESAMPV